MRVLIAEDDEGIRDLLHDQVSLEQRCARRNSHEYLQARRQLDSSWNELIALEHRYRSLTGTLAGPAAATG